MKRWRWWRYSPFDSYIFYFLSIKVLKFLNKLTVVEFTMYALSSQIFLYANFTEMFFPLKKYKIIFQNFARCEAKLVKIN